MVREYVEEFLGRDDAWGHYGAPINYLNDVPYSGLFRAQLSGEIRTYLLGIVLDPVTWKPTILVTCIFPHRYSIDYSREWCETTAKHPRTANKAARGKGAVRGVAIRS